MRFKLQHARGVRTDDRNRFDFNLRISRQPGSLHSGPGRRILPKILSVNLIHRVEIVHVREKDRRLHNLIQTCPGSSEYSR